MESLVTAIVTGGLTLAGVIFSNLRSQTVTAVRIDELARHFEKHNGVIERTNALEQDETAAKPDIADLRGRAEGK